MSTPRFAVHHPERPSSWSALIPVLLAASIAGGAVACAQPSAPTEPAASATAAAGLLDRDPQLAKKLVAEGALLLDVRTQEEFDERHLDGAEFIPVQELPQRLAEVDALVGGDKDKPIVVYCKSGGRAGRAKQMLLEAGHKRVTNVGGLTDYPAE